MIFFRRRKLHAGLTTTRLEFFSDAVFAIAITLLVLAITVPELSKEAISRGELLPAILNLWPKFLSYAISFSVIGIFWVGHHIMFHYIKRSDRTLLWLNTVFLMSVSFIPFPAALIGEYGSSRVAVILYGGTLVVAGLLFEFIWFYASTGHRLVDKQLDEKLIRKASKIVLVAPVVYTIAILFSFINPFWSRIIYIVVPLLYILPSPIDELVEFASEK